MMVKHIRATGQKQNPKSTLKETGIEEHGDKGNQTRDKDKLTHLREPSELICS